MGYYENPPMIEPDRSGSIIANSIIKSSEAIAKGLLMRGERKREEEKERRLTIQKMQDRKNTVDLQYNEALSKWSKDTVNQNQGLNEKVYEVIQSKMTLAADSKIALLTETDPKKRQEYLTNIRNADGFLDNSAKFGETIAMQTATWREAAKALKIGVPGGYVINGESDEQIVDNTAAIEILGGMDQTYKNSKIDVQPDEKGDGVLLTVTGEHDDGRPFSVTINSKEFMSADNAGVGGLLLPVEQLDDFYSEAKKEVSDDKGNLYAGYLSETRETVDLPSKGGDIYQIRNGQRLQDKAIRARIDKKSEIRASSILASYNASSLKTLVNYTLSGDPSYYDNQFKLMTPEQQKAELSKMLTDKTFDGLTKDLEKTTDANGNVVYWNPTASIGIKPKPPKEPKAPVEKPEPRTYREEYYDNIISKGDDITLVEHLNKLSGNVKFVDRNEIFQMWKNAAYGSTSKTNAEKFKTDAEAKKEFNKTYPQSDGNIYKETSSGIFSPLKGYNLKKAEDRVKLALDQTSKEGEKKILQNKLYDARLSDWITANPKKSSETLEQYDARIKKAGF